MNKLLPNIYDLKPISGNRDTFGETVFTRDFNLLSFRDKLQVASDIIRQTMLTKVFPNPKTEIATMTGDSYTSSVVAIEYLKEMQLGSNHFLAFAKVKPYERSDANTTHFVVLLTDNNGEWYRFDCSPFIGYECGKVEAMRLNRAYERYYLVNPRIDNLLRGIRLAMYEIHTTGATKVDVEALLHKANQYPILEGYAVKLKSLLGIVSLDEKNGEYAKKALKKQIKQWKRELNSLICCDDNYERQLELAQYITQEWKKYDSSLERFFVDNGERIPLSHLTPRYFYERKLNVVIIKPSSYLIGVDSIVRESFLRHGHGAIAEYQTNLGETSKDGINIMRIFHPDGYKYERSMRGSCNVFLVNRTSEELEAIKLGLRRSLGKNLNGHDVTWFDNSPIKWDPIITNIVHTADSSSETCCHYTSSFPEHQLMTRYMYPNPKLVV